ncbi:jockey\pol [Symbiodinium sp. CCMP2592]|nr:jockey\pol [Symbiodinium sp. CCMP2592]
MQIEFLSNAAMMLLLLLQLFSCVQLTIKTRAAAASKVAAKKASAKPSSKPSSRPRRRPAAAATCCSSDTSTSDNSSSSTTSTGAASCSSNLGRDSDSLQALAPPIDSPDSMEEVVVERYDFAAAFAEAFGKAVGRQVPPSVVHDDVDSDEIVELPHLDPAKPVTEDAPGAPTASTSQPAWDAPIAAAPATRACKTKAVAKMLVRAQLRCPQCYGYLSGCKTGIEKYALEEFSMCRYPFVTSLKVYEKRAAIWNALDALVQALPSRHFMYLAGDFNTDLLQEHPYVGVTRTHKGKERAAAQDQHIFQNLLRTHGLRALNSWDNQSTYVDPHGPASRVDFVLARTMQATGCPVTVQPQIHFASWRSGARHLPLLGMIDLKAWCRFRDRTPAKLAIDQDALCRACRPGPEHELLRQAFAAKQHLFTADLLPSQAEAELRNICVKAFPLQRNRTIALQWQNPEVGQDLSLTWQLRRSLKQQAAFWRREHWQAQLLEAEQASKAGNPLKFFQVVQRLAPKRAHARVQIRDPKGQILTPALEDKALAEYWQGIYSSTSLPYQAVCLREPLLVTQQELHDALRGLKQRKAVAKDLAPAAVWKALASPLSCYLNAVLSKIWQSGPLHIPAVWARSDLHFLLKPQKVTRRPQDLRPIALQSAAAKAVLTVFKQRLQHSFLEAMRTLPQYAYVMGRSTHEAISRVAAHCKEVRDLLRSQSLTVFDRFEGACYNPCIGGAQLGLDLSKAFDLLPRRTLQLLLQDTDLSLEEQQVLLEWHQAGKYRIRSKGNEHPVFVRLECGVRQGCVLSPFLWGLFTKHIQNRLDEANGPGWTARRGTFFADDMHFKWVFRTEAELHSIRLEVLNIFRILRELGMQANPDKSTFIIGARGQQARKWVKRWVRKDSEGRKQFHFGGAKQDRVPVASQLTYLGVVLSYRNFELATANHRIGVAAGHRDRLRRILHARRVLSVGHRLRLWRIMVQTSQLYAVEAVGLTTETAKLLHIQTMRHMRAIIGSARHVDGDSDQLFMLKHCIPDCVELVKTKCDAFCQRLARTELEIPCFGAEGILQWAQFVRDSLPPPYIAKPRIRHPVLILSLYHCLRCPVSVLLLVFTTLHDLKTHEGKAHKKDPVLQEKQLWGHLLPSLEEAAHDWQMGHDDSKGDKPSETKSKELNKRRRTNDNPGSSSDKQDRKGKGKGKGKAKSSKDASKMELKEAVQLMAAMTLQLVDQASRVQLDTSFLLTMKNEPGPENLLPIMYKVWKAWKTMQEQEPSKLDKPLRCSMMISMLLEIKARAKKLLDDSEQQERMKALEWIDSEGRWVYRKWSPTQEALYLDQSRKPIPQTVFIEQLDQAMTLLVRPENMPRFQSRELAPEMKGYAVTFHVDIGLRSEAEPLWQIFNTWVDLQAWVLGAVRIRPHRLKRPPAADRLSVWLGNH